MSLFIGYIKAQTLNTGYIKAHTLSLKTLRKFKFRTEFCEHQLDSSVAKNRNYYLSWNLQNDDVMALTKPPHFP